LKISAPVGARVRADWKIGDAADSKVCAILSASAYCRFSDAHLSISRLASVKQTLILC
jgi:hypothetical protein